VLGIGVLVSGFYLPGVLRTLMDGAATLIGTGG
jgi:hypothetical protein